MLPGAGIVNNSKLIVQTLAYGGDAVGRLDSGKVCFVPGGLPGEELEVRVVQEKNSFVRAELVQVLSAVPNRKDSPCPAYERGCPGCAYLHCDYETELKWKQTQFADFLERAGLLGDGVMHAPVGAPQRLGYRNKLKLHRTKDGKFGMVGRDNESIIPVQECLLAHPEINLAVKQYSCSSDADTVTWRFTEQDKVTGFSTFSEVKKSNWLTEDIPGVGKFKVPVGGFFQTNIAVAAKLIERAVEEIRNSGSDELIELYCGCGVFTIAAAKVMPQLRSTGIEVMAESIRAARWNAGKHGVEKRCSFFAGDAGAMLARHGKGKGKVLLVDPPRSGLSRPAAEAVISASPERIIYISCAADTLRRDLLLFQKKGYVVSQAGIFDMFPSTAHFESMVTLIRR